MPKLGKVRNMDFSGQLNNSSNANISRGQDHQPEPLTFNGRWQLFRAALNPNLASM